MNADRNHTTTTTANDLGKQGDSFSQRDHLPVVARLDRDALIDVLVEPVERVADPDTSERTDLDMIGAGERSGADR